MHKQFAVYIEKLLEIIQGFGITVKKKDTNIVTVDAIIEEFINPKR